MASPHHHPGPADRRSPRRRLRTAVLAAGAAVALLGAPLPALAAPADDVAAASAAQADLAAQVGQLADRVRAAEEQLQRMTVEAEAAADAALVAQAELAAAQGRADQAAAELAAAQADVAAAEEGVADVGREAYMGTGDRYGDVALLLDSSSPEELLQRAATLEVLGEQRAAVLTEFETVEAQVAAAEAQARAAVAERDAAARTAAEAQAAAEAHLAAAQADFDSLAAEKAALDAQLRDAQIELLRLQGIADAEAAWAASQATGAGTLSASGGAVPPTTGRVTSCYGSRWGTMHYGVDIAAPIGTPVYAPVGGVVLQAGAASGFGQAVYLQHPNGSITLYGHVDRFLVGAGQVVVAGQQIATVGNRGQSTGPHLHFEVHQGGLYASRTDPVPWLSALGISLGGAC
ncbi:M23 family metallopeptidase [Blastococcus sp. SYSU D00820]